jgi:hypothetical protein
MRAFPAGTRIRRLRARLPEATLDAQRRLERLVVAQDLPLSLLLPMPSSACGICRIPFLFLDLASPDARPPVPGNVPGSRGWKA